MKDEYYDITKPRHVKKSEEQKKRWRNSRERSVKRFIDVVKADMRVDEITREDALALRQWWVDKVAEGMSANSANRELGILNEMFKTWSRIKGVDLPNPFSNLALEDKKTADRPSFSRAWVKGKILAPGALDGLNDEARDVLLMLVNTGLRPSEVTDAPLADFVLGAEIPFLRVAAHGRELKVAHTARDIPLLGVSLDAAKRIVKRGGVKRYRMKASNWSALVNKYMGNNGLKETPKHVVYSLRHYVEDALLAAKVSDRVRADILGHKYERPRYGDGGALAGRKEALELIAL